MFLFILAMAAAEVSVGLALVLQLHHRFKTLDVDAAERNARLNMLDAAVADSRDCRWPASSCWRLAGRVCRGRPSPSIGVGSIGRLAPVLALLVSELF